MKILIIEDELHTANRLQQLIFEYNKDYEILAILTSVKSSVEWLKQHKQPELIFQDIQLNDGLCFEIYREIDIVSPVIFTTAYSEYALKSFELNSIDYLVKPYDFNDIKRVLDKFLNFSAHFRNPQFVDLKEILTAKAVIPRKRFLIRLGDNYKAVNSSDIAYIFSEGGLSFAHTFEGNRYLFDQSLSDLSAQLDSEAFFRVNRNCILNSQSIQKISNWFNNRLKLQLNPPTEEDIVVSRERVKDFKAWMGG
jgi:two-component system, LytTR family, response regulator LytT